MGLDLGDESGSVPQEEASGPPAEIGGDDYLLVGTGSKSLQTVTTEEKTRIQDVIMAHLVGKADDIGHNRLVVVSGMAEGFDKALAIVTILLGLRLRLAIPNRGYGRYYWRDHSLTGENRLRAFEAILSNAEQITYVMEDIYHVGSLYHKGRHANFLRNDHMVEIGHEFVVWDSKSPGTKDCFASILKSGKPYTILK